MRKFLSSCILLIFLNQVVIAQTQNCCPQFSLNKTEFIHPCQGDEKACIDRGGSNGGGQGGPTDFACKNSVSSYTVFPNLPGYNYVWAVTGGTPATFTGNPINITWGNGATGQLVVYISNNTGTCLDTLSADFCLLTPPSAAFTFLPNTNICATTNIAFSNASTGGNTYYWDFGDGNTSSAANPSHQYALPGTYNVLLTVSNVFNGEKCGCSDTMLAVITVNPGTFPEIISNCKKMLCPNDTASYCVNSTCPPFSWTVNGGTIIGASNQSCVLVQWNTPPTNYPTSVTVSTGTCSGQCSNIGTLNVPVLYNNIPITGATVVCKNAAQTYSLPALPGTFYSWSVTSGGTIAGADSNSVEFNVVWTGAEGTTQTITCNYSNPFTGCSGTSTLTVDIKPKFLIGGASPICVGSSGGYFVTDGGLANWTMNPNIGFNPPGPINNQPSILLNWTSVGNYTINAVPVITTNYCTASASLSVVVNDTPAIGNIIGPVVVCPGGSYVYSVSSNMNAGLFSWFVSAGGTILSQMGAHQDSVVVQWNGAGPHTINVYQTVKGCPSQIVSLNITNVPPPVILTGTPVACVDQNFNYTANNNLPVGAYTWNILPVNSGTITSGQGSSSIFIQWHGSTLSTTTFDTVIVTTCGGTDTFFVTVTQPPATSIIPSGFLCSGMTLSSTLSGVSYQWYLNDNPLPSTNTQSITNVGVAGIYMVYVYQSPGACPSVAKITIPPYQKPYLVLPCGGIFEYKAPDTTVIKYCSGSAISSTFTVNPNGNSLSYQWYQNSYGNPVGANSPTYTATQTGVYWVVTTNLISACMDTLGIVKIDTICCDPSYTLSFTHYGCDSIHFTGSITPTPVPLFPYQWCFGDGASAITIVDSVTHKYKYAGQYTVCQYMKVKSLSGDTCAASNCKTIDVNLVADFDGVVNCGTVQLTDLSTAMPAYAGYSYNWSTTGPGTFSPNNTAANPLVTYTASGTYTITLVISKNGCTSTVAKTFTVYVVNASISGPTTVCAGTDAPFSASPYNSLFQYAWNFGDSATSFIPNTNHSYPAPPPNNYTIQLIVTDTHGCADTTTQLITVIVPPVMTITADTFICPGNSVLLTVTPGFQTYQWYHNGNLLSGANTNTYSTSAIGSYWVVATSNNSGCSITSPICQVFLSSLPTAEIVGNGLACWDGVNPTSIFLYNSLNGGGYTYQWSLNGSPLGGEINYYLSTTQNAIGTYSYSLEVTNSSGCIARDTFCVVVGLSPTVTITPSSAGALCAGTVYTFTATATPPNPNYVYNWSNGVTGNVMSTGQAGFYTVSVIDPASGCVGYSNSVGIKKSPTTILFPVGCDTLCDTSSIIPPLAINSNNTYSIYTIEWFDNGNYGSPVYTGSVFPVSSLVPLLGNHNISIVVTSANGCTDTSDVYNIYVVNCNSTVPISAIQRFGVMKQNMNALLNWEINASADIVSFEVQRSSDGRNFSAIDNLPFAFGKSNYSFTDYNLASGTYYYRIKIIDKNGGWLYTTIRNVKFSTKNSIQLFPNPVNNGSFTILSSQGINKEIRILDSRGILLRSFHSSTGVDKVDATGWSKGIYMVSVISDDGQIQTKQLVMIK